MPFLGQQPVEGYKTTAKQTITGDGSTSYTLNNAVTSGTDLEVFVNSVRQEPGTDYSASGNTITFTTAVESSDSCWLVYQGKAFTTTSIESDNLADGSVTAAKLDTTYAPLASPSFTGNVGIGTTSPSANLDVRGTSSTDLISGLFTTAGIGPTDDTNSIFIGCEGNDERGIRIKAKKDNSSGAHSLYIGTSANGATPADQMKIDKLGGFYFNSGFGTYSLAYGVRGWVKWNGNNGGIYGSGGVSSVGRAAVGDYDIYWSTAMPDGNYAVTCCSGESRIDRGLSSAGLLTNKVTMVYEDISGNRVDCDPLMIMAVR